VALTLASRVMLVAAVGSFVVGVERLLNAWWLVGIGDVHGRVVIALAFATAGVLLATTVVMREDRNAKAR
jgi:hypothetical protein